LFTGLTVQLIQKALLDPESHVHGFLALGDLLLNIGDIRRHFFHFFNQGFKMLQRPRVAGVRLAAALPSGEKRALRTRWL